MTKTLSWQGKNHQKALTLAVEQNSSFVQLFSQVNILLIIQQRMMKKWLREEGIGYELIVNKMTSLFFFADVPQQVFRTQFATYVFLDYDDVISGQGNFYPCLIRFLTKIQVPSFYLGSLDAFLPENIAYPFLPSFDSVFQFETYHDSPSSWQQALSSLSDSDDSIQSFIKYRDNHNQVVLFSDSNEWAMFLRKWDDYVIVGLASNLIDTFSSSFSAEQVNGFTDIDELTAWLSQIIGQPSKAEYINQIRANYTSLKPLLYK